MHMVDGEVVIYVCNIGITNFLGMFIMMYWRQATVWYEDIFTDELIHVMIGRRGEGRQKDHNRLRD